MIALSGMVLDRRLAVLCEFEPPLDPKLREEIQSDAALEAAAVGSPGKTCGCRPRPSPVCGLR